MFIHTTVGQTVALCFFLPPGGRRHTPPSPPENRFGCNETATTARTTHCFNGAARVCDRSTAIFCCASCAMDGGVSFSSLEAALSGLRFWQARVACSATYTQAHSYKHVFLWCNDRGSLRKSLANRSTDLALKVFGLDQRCQTDGPRAKCGFQAHIKS